MDAPAHRMRDGLLACSSADGDRRTNCRDLGCIHTAYVGRGRTAHADGTDGTRMFTFAGSISDIDPAPYACHPCVSQIGIDVNASGATHGTLTYGNESYRVGGGFLDTEGALALLIEGGPILLPAPVAAGEIRSFSTPFTASGLVVPPAVPGTGLAIR
jgi:hypothetical protein